MEVYGNWIISSIFGLGMSAGAVLHNLIFLFAW